MSLYLLFTPLLSILLIPLIHSISSLTLSLLSLGLLNFLLLLTLLLSYNPSSTAFQFIFSSSYLTLGLDGFSLWLIFIVNLIHAILLLDALSLPSHPSSKFYLLCLSLINLLSILVFSVLDIFQFYIAFEAILIPMFLFIAYFGSRNKKVYANYLFILYTLFGSLFLLFAILSLYYLSGTTDYLLLLATPIDTLYQIPLFLAFFIAFAVKLP